MRRTVRVFSAVAPAERLGRVVAVLPGDVVQTLRTVADRTDMPLVAGSWHDDDAGCLVANAVASVARADIGTSEADRVRTLDLRMLDAFPRMSSRDLNLLIVAWDEAAAQSGATTDADLRALLRSGLAWAATGAATPSPGAGDDAATGSTSPLGAGDDAVIVGAGTPSR